MNIIKCAKFNVILTEDYIRIKSKKSFRTMQPEQLTNRVDSIGIEFHNNFSPPTLTFYEILILKPAEFYSNIR